MTVFIGFAPSQSRSKPLRYKHQLLQVFYTMNISLDIIIFAVIAVVLLWRLRGVLGERHEDEPKNNHSIVEQLRQMQKGDNASSADGLAGAPNDPVMALQNNARGGDAAGYDATRWAQDLPNYSIVANATAHNHLAQFLNVDPSFRPDQFLASAQKAFMMIIEAYATNARGTLEFLVAPPLLQRFMNQLDAREERHETYNVQFFGVKKVLISEAELNGTMARITVDFTAEQSILHKDGEGRILNDNDGRRRETSDRWIFQKDLKDPTPSWLLVAALDPIDD